MSLNNLPVLVISGPTTCGKSALGLAIAESFNGTVINADSMQIYRDLPLLTFQPTSIDMNRVPHLLYSILDGKELCSVAYWLSLVNRAIINTQTSRRLPIIVGGTGLYIQALQKNLLTPIPRVPEIIRYKARVLMEEIGVRAFQSLLTARDPAIIKRISDPQRLQRAWEILESTGYSLLNWQKTTQNFEKKLQKYFCITLMPPRVKLYTACNRRFSYSVVNSILPEVNYLLNRSIPKNHPILKALGVPTLTKYLHGDLTLAEAISEIQRETRHYAKRQYTWFRIQSTKETLFLQEQYNAGDELPPIIRRLLSRFFH